MRKNYKFQKIVRKKLKIKNKEEENENKD